MRETFILKIGSTMPHLAVRRGDYEDWIAEGLDVGPVRVCVGAVEPLPPLERVRALVVTGSSALVTDREPWSERAGAWLAEVARAQIPTLAICYGHQLLADVLDGGEVAANARGREIGMIDVRLTDEGRRDPLFAGLGDTLRMSSSHRQAVRALPEGAVWLGVGEDEPYQAFRLGERVWSVQFHPEWDAEVITAYLEDRVDTLREEGLDPDALLAGVAPTDHGRRLLARFGELSR
jgi:GMP synthase (glutamine-hydrolysing)